MVSEAIQRIKGISQHGITTLLGLTPPFSRFDHSQLDYFLGDSEFLKLANHKEIRAAVESLNVVEGRIAVNEVGAARWLAYTFGARGEVWIPMPSRLNCDVQGHLTCESVWHAAARRS